MIRAIRLALVFLFCMQFANAATPTDSLKDQVKELQGTFKKQGESLKRQNDSLQREILFYKVKEDFYTESLGAQTGIFSFITSALLALAAFVSWKFISDRIQTVKRELSSEIVSVKMNLEDTQENEIIIRYQTLKNAFDLGYVMLKPLTENAKEFGFGIYIGIILMHQASQAIKIHPKRLINNSKFNEDPQHFIDIFNSLSLSVKESILLNIEELEESNLEIIGLIIKMYAPMCEYTLTQLIEDIFEGSGRKDIIEIKYLYLNMIKEVERKVSENNKRQPSVIEIEEEK